MERNFYAKYKGQKENAAASISFRKNTMCFSQKTFKMLEIFLTIRQWIGIDTNYLR